MRRKTAKYQSRRRRATVADTPQVDPAPEEDGAPRTVDRQEHDRRMALVRRVSGGQLSRLGERIRREQEGRNGGHCERLKAGSVDCPCEYCRAFWSRLETRLAS